MMFILFIFVVLLSILLIIALVISLKRLLAFDSIWDDIDVVLTNYIKFMEDKTSRGIMSNHPEIMEFHQKTVEVKETMKVHGKTVRNQRGYNG